MSNTYGHSAKFYDLDNKQRNDVPFYCAYAKAGAVLELACGTGRVSIPLAENGAQVHGLDLSPGMLGVFREKLAQQSDEIQSRVELTEGNMADFNLGKQFPLIIIPFRSFQVLTQEEDIAGCLQCVKEHLTTDGKFIVNCFNPGVSMRKWMERYGKEAVVWERDGVMRKTYGRPIDLKNQVIYPVFVYEMEHGERIEEPLELKYYYPRQLKKILRKAGFKIVEQYGSFERGSMKRRGGEQIYVCEVAK